MDLFGVYETANRCCQLVYRMVLILIATFTSKDQFGFKVKLANGNVSSRVIPVVIHDLDHEDKSFLEEESGGFKWDFLFDNIRNESESKYQTEHERVRKWLEENKALLNMYASYYSALFTSFCHGNLPSIST